jgi:hypothetical protein
VAISAGCSWLTASLARAYVLNVVITGLAMLIDSACFVINISSGKKEKR